MFHNLQNYDSHLIFQEVGKYNIKISVIPKTIEKYIIFATKQQPKKNSINPGLLLVFLDSLHFLNDPLDNLVKNLRENDFYHLSQECAAIVLHLLKKKGYIPLTTVMALKNLMKVYLAKINFISHWLIVKLVMKIVINRFLSFEKYLKWKNVKLSYFVLKNRCFIAN